MLRPFWQLPEGYGFSIAAVWLIWLAVVAIFCPFPAWLARVKARCRNWWLRYHQAGLA